METKSVLPVDENVAIRELNPSTISDYGMCGYKNVKKHSELQRKIAWYNTYYEKGLRVKIIETTDGQSQGMIEFIPGELAHRPVNAPGFLFIHCLFVGYRKEFKGKGYASALINDCISEAKKLKKSGVAVVTRNGSFMSKKDIFLKHGFELADKAQPDFELMVLKFNSDAETPKFDIPSAGKYPDGLTVMRSAQCPYSVKNVEAILETAAKLNIKAHLIEISGAEEARQTPSPFGTFCIVYNGNVISHHPISNKRFENIMKKELSG